MEKKTYPTAAQKTRLISLLEADEELRQGKFSSSFTKKVAEARWRKIAIEVNSISGAKKEWKDWRKVSFILFYLTSASDPPLALHGCNFNT